MRPTRLPAAPATISNTTMDSVYVAPRTDLPATNAVGIIALGMLIAVAAMLVLRRRCPRIA